MVVGGSMLSAICFLLFCLGRGQRPVSLKLTLVAELALARHHCYVVFFNIVQGFRHTGAGNVILLFSYGTYVKWPYWSDLSC